MVIGNLSQISGVGPSMESVYLFLLGGVGAICYAFPTYLQGRTAGEPYSLSTFVFSVFVGVVFGGVLTPFIGKAYPWTVDPEPYPLAFVLGLMANPLLPRIINRGKAIFSGFSFNNGGAKR